MAAADWDVLVVGAGVTGLAAVKELQRARLRVLCLEAKNRIGGRIATVRDPLAAVPIELGAEFVHGRPPETWDLARAGALTIYDCGEHAVHLENGKAQGEEDAWLLADRVLEDMQRAASDGPDQSFSEFLAHSSHSEEAKRLASSFVEGFNAAHKEVIGIHSLAKDAEAADAIDGDRSFRILNGYDAIPHLLLRSCGREGNELRLNSVVEKIDWKPGEVTTCFRIGDSGRETVRSRRAIITIPLGVLQAEPNVSGAIRFRPEPSDVLAAARSLAFGNVSRMVLRFREAFWESKPELSDVGFLLSAERYFPTWWTTLPIRSPILTGWSAGPHTDELLGKPKSEIVDHALTDLSRITGTSRNALGRLLEGVHFHDWHSDVFARGAYSYVPVGAMAAREILAKPVAETLYFTGEATELNGHSATVHGAIASGYRTARQVMQTFGS